MGKISDFYTMPHPPIIIPQVGQGEEKKIQATYDACNQVASEIAKIKPDTIIIVTPHGPVFSDAVAISTDKNIAGDLGRFGVPKVGLNLKINQSLAKDIIERAEKENIVMAEITKTSARRYGVEYSLDHGSIVPLYFINKKFSDYQIIHITYGMLPKMQLYKLGMIIQKAVEGSKTKAVFIGSGDLSHKLKDKGPYDFNPSGPKFDQELITLLEEGNVQGVFNMDPKIVEEAGECGLRSFYMMLGAMNGHDIKGKLLSYEGTFGVGYAVMKFIFENPYVRLARESLTHYLTTGNYMQVPDHLPRELTSIKGGVFVTLNKEGRLRGCIGTIFPRMDNIAQEIIRNAVSAGIHDTRFDTVSEDELEELTFSVDVLTEPKAATKSELDPKKYGVIVRSGAKTGLLLPDLEGVDTVDYQLSIALDKGGISQSEDYTIEKFKVIRHR